MPIYNLLFSDRLLFKKDRVTSRVYITKFQVKSRNLLDQEKVERRNSGSRVQSEVTVGAKKDLKVKVRLVSLRDW